jgi:Beta-xylosidase
MTYRPKPAKHTFSLLNNKTLNIFFKMNKTNLKLNRMSRTKLFLTTALLTLFFTNGFAADNTKKVSIAKNAPVFSKVVYQGNDQLYTDHPLKADEFYNPILQGCYPDPSITRKGDDYYLVCSSFAIFPGVPIFHSKDLVNWKQIGHVLDRTSQLQLQNCGISAGIYAPQILYNANNDTFYMITTQFSGGFGNMVVKTKDPFSGWSDPIKLKFDGIDPSLFFDDNGKAYIVHNDAPAKGKELYNGHRVIKVWEYDVEKDQIIPGTDKVVVDGGVDLAKKPIWIEAPHIYKKGGKYYLMCAEGGTGDWHSEVIFESDNPKGPYTPAPSNPILSQRYLNGNRANKVDWAGHADLVKGPEDKYYAVFLGVRPNEKNRVNTGRETFMLPVDWSGEFPVFENGLVPLEAKLKMPKGVESKTGKDGFFPNGNFTYNEDFTAPKLDYRWVGIRGPREEFTSITKKGLVINPFPVSIKELKATSTLFYRQQHISFSFCTTLSYVPTSEKDLAGIVCYQNERFNYVFGITKKENSYYLLLEKTTRSQSKIVASAKIEVKTPIRLQVKSVGDNYEFSYSTNGTDFLNLGGVVSGDILSTNVAGGFTGAMIGLYATSANNSLPE